MWRQDNLIVYLEISCFSKFSIMQEKVRQFKWLLLGWSCRIGIELPTVEVRFDNLSVKAKCHVGSRGLPTLWNSFLNIIEVHYIFSFRLFYY